MSPPTLNIYFNKRQQAPVHVPRWADEHHLRYRLTHILSHVIKMFLQHAELLEFTSIQMTVTSTHTLVKRQFTIQVRILQLPQRVPRGTLATGSMCSGWTVLNVCLARARPDCTREIKSWPRAWISQAILNNHDLLLWNFMTKLKWCYLWKSFVYLSIFKGVFVEWKPFFFLQWDQNTMK